MILSTLRSLERQITGNVKIKCPAYSADRVYLSKLKEYVPRTCDWRKIDLVPHISQTRNECYIAATQWNLQMFGKMLNKHFEPTFEELRDCDFRNLLTNGGDARRLLEYCMKKPVYSPKKLPLTGYMRLFPLSEEVLIRAIAQQPILVQIDAYPSLSSYKDKGGVYRKKKWEVIKPKLTIKSPNHFDVDQDLLSTAHLVNAIGYDEDNFILKNNWNEEDSILKIPRREENEDEDEYGPLGIYRYGLFPYMGEEVMNGEFDTLFNMNLMYSNMAVGLNNICYCDKQAHAVLNNPIWPKDVRNELRKVMKLKGML